LALALRTNSGLRTWVHLDERAGAFFALGMAKVSRRPVAILVTSGTAAMELAPAMVEARYGRTPLLALTADRPPELRDRGAAQAIDQDHLFGRFAKWYAELPVPGEGGDSQAHVRDVIGRAVAMATAAPAGPVHLNVPFREPLIPVVEPTLADAPRSRSTMSAGNPPVPSTTEGGDAHTVTLTGGRTLAEDALVSLTDRLAAARHGVIVCGPLDMPGFAEAVTGLAAASGFPILAEALSNVRFGGHDRSHVVSRADAILREAGFAGAHRPDLVLRFGGTPTSKTLLEWMAAGRAPQIVVDDGGWSDATLLPLTVVQAEPVGLAWTLAERLAGAAERPAAAGPAGAAGPDRAWLGSWQAADSRARESTFAWLDSLAEPFEGQVFAAIGSTLPDGAIVLAGNSMPVRDMEAFLGTGPGRLRCLGNRGASGIDGLLSTALGAAAVADGPVVAVVGDVSFIHDLNALVAAARLGIEATIVLVNNDGGGIFSFLPQATADRPGSGLPEHYEELFGTPHGVAFGPLVEALGARHRPVAPKDLAPAIETSLRQPGVGVLEVRTGRTRNVELHRELQAAVGRALAPLARSEGPS
jgi:2-succinyl-5-enolpyruvyl-6-hydroxy-3-cyclohexene-1-carboxylate synthase